MTTLCKTAAVAFAAAGTAASTYLIFRYRHSASQALWRWRLRRTVYETDRRVVVVEREEQWAAVEEELLRSCSSLGVLGFDCEWVTAGSTRRPVALLQLATHTGLCVLVRLCKLRQIPPTLLDVLSDPRIFKVGVAPAEDCKLLFGDHNIIVNGALDLRDFFSKPPAAYPLKKKKNKNRLKHSKSTDCKTSISERCDAEEMTSYAAAADEDDNSRDNADDVHCNSSNATADKCIPFTDKESLTSIAHNNITLVDGHHAESPSSTHVTDSAVTTLTTLVTGPTKLGLSGLAEYYLSRTLDKDWRVRASDWEAEQLSHRQMSYAAEDARSGLHIMLVLLERLPRCQALLACSALAPLFSWSSLSKTMIREAASNIVVNSTQGGWYTVVSNRKDNLKMEPSISVAKSKSYRRAYSLRKTPLYHNSVLWAPDNEPLCTVDPKKAYWYVDNDLGEIVQEAPLIVRLKFEPTGRPQKEGMDGYFYLNERQNICVVCGKDDSYIRKNVVPHEYRKQFPEILKSHQNHDVVLLCTECHQLSNQRDGVLRYHLAEQHNAPIGNSTDVKVVVDGNLKVIKSAGKALLKNCNKIPEERINELKAVLMDFFKTDELNEEFISKAAALDVAIVNDSYEPHGLRVYKHYEKIGVIHFERLWRQNFLDTMKPKFMPTGWSVDHNHAKLKLKMARYPPNDPIREQLKLALVGRDGHIDIPYVPQNVRPKMILISKKNATSEQMLDDEMEMEDSDDLEDNLDEMFEKR